MFRQCGSAGRKHQTGMFVEKKAGAAQEPSLGGIMTRCFLTVLGKSPGYHPAEIAASHSGVIKPSGSHGEIPNVRTSGVCANVSSPKKGESGTQTLVNQRRRCFSSSIGPGFFVGYHLHFPRTERDSVK